MRFTIKSDIPGRISMRLGMHVLSEDEARGIAVHLLGLSGVKRASVHEANGAVIVVYEPGMRNRKRILSAVGKLDMLSLPSLPETSIEVPHDLAASIEANRFALQASSLVFWHIVRRIALPAPLRAAFTIFQALRFIKKGLASLMRGRLTVDVLDATAIAVSIARGSFTDAATVMTLLRLTDKMEHYVQRRTQIALSENLVIRPESVWMVVDGVDVSVPMAEVRQGNLLHLRTGQVLPVDGEVAVGEGEVNEAPLTGEAALVHKTAGSSVYAGTALESGDLVVRVTAEPGRARIDRIAAMVEQTSDMKADAESRAEHLADALVPVSFAAFFGILGITRSLATAMAVLMVDYSCAVRLSTPICVISAMGEASRRNTVIKGGRYLEALARADTVVFDKTGTLTCARPTVTCVLPFGDADEEKLLCYAACIEEHFPHSVARAIVEEARARGLHHENELHAEVDYVVAHGIKTKVNGHDACIGSAHFIFEDEGVKRPPRMGQRIRKAAPGSSVVYLAIDGVLEGAICLDDELRPEAHDVLKQLRKAGIRHIVMLTGDSEAGAAAVAERLGIDEVHAQVLPEQKSTFVQRLRDEGHIVCMVGDGINDSPALASADVSVALADASDIARAVADVSVLDASLEKLVMLRRLSQATMDRMRSGYRFIVAFNTSLIVLRVAGALPLTTAAFLHNASTLGITVANTRAYLPAGK